MGIKLVWEGKVLQLTCNSSSINWDRKRGKEEKEMTWSILFVNLLSQPHNGIF